MGKLRSGRVKRIPQVGITSDRYQFLGLEQAEPNLGDPKVGLSSVGVNPIKAGAFYQLAAIGEYPGERFWSTKVGIGSTLGVISVYANNVLPNSAFERIHGLNFVGTGVTLETPPLELFDGIGIATVRFTVTDIQNRGEVGQVLYNTSSGYAYGASELYYVSNNVGIGSTIPQYKLDILGDARLNGKLSVGGTTGILGQYLSATGTGVTWSTFPPLRTGISTVATVGQTGFTTSYNVGFLDVYVNGVRLTDSEYVASNGSTIVLNAPCFGGENVDIFAYGLVSTGAGSGGIGVVGGESYWVAGDIGIHTLSSVGIGTTNPTELLTVFGDARVVGILTVGPASITLDGTTNIINVGSGVTINGSTGIIEASAIVIGGTIITGAAVTSITAGSGISVNQSTGNVTISATGGGSSGISTDSEKLDGEDSTYYLDYDNFTNTPTNLSDFNNDVGFTTFSGDYGDLENSPTNLSDFNNDVGFTTFSGDYGDLENTPTNLSDFNNDVGFTTFSGDYGDLENSPTNLSDFSNDVGFITSFTDTNYWVSTVAGIHTLGNVGVGTTNPTTKLQVGGTVTATAFVGDGSGLTNLPGGSGGTSDFVRTSAGIHTLGNVGVGTTNPLVQLQISGTLGFEVFTGTYGNRGLNISIGDTTTASNIIPDADGYQGINNIFMGIGAGNSTTTGNYNNFFGTKAGRDNTTGSSNNFFGLLAGGGKRGIITGVGITTSTTLAGEADNSYSGVSATGGSGVDADFSVFRDGSGAVIEVNITSGGYDYNVGDILTIDGVDVGGSSGTDDITITINTVEGSTNTGNHNNFLGDSAGRYNTTGCYNNFFGSNAGQNNITGCYNNFFGSNAGRGKRGIITSINILGTIE